MTDPQVLLCDHPIIFLELEFGATRALRLKPELWGAPQGQRQSLQNRVWAGGWRLAEYIITAGRAFVLVGFRLHFGAMEDELAERR